MLNGNAEEAADFLSRHIDVSKNTVRHITLHRIQAAKSRYNINIRAER